MPCLPWERATSGGMFTGQLGAGKNAVKGVGDGDALGFAEVAEFDTFELDAEVFGDDAATGEDGEVFEHG